jgi:hypothetical protein
MSNKDGWLEKMDRLFLLSPTFYAILSGALIGTAVNLLTGLIFTEEVSSIHVILMIVFLLCSSGLLAYIGIVLEGLRGEAKGNTEALKRKILNRRKRIYPVFWTGFAFLIVGVSLVVRILAS